MASMKIKAKAKKKELHFYSPAEERMNIWTHGLGFVAASVGLVLLLMRATSYGDVWHTVSFAVFGVSMMILYAASTTYHAAKTPRLRYRLKIFDHAAIYVLIAGTYTPFALVTLHGQTGWVIFASVWGIAAAGVVLKLFFTGRFDLLSTIMYVVMGWIIVLAINPLRENLSGPGLYWIMAGGIAYTVGAVLYSIRTLPFNHAIFHVFVLAGSFCHFWTVYYYV
jgi:hemolysin III